MITMLYEKTLSRKIVGELALSNTSIPASTVSNGAATTSDIAQAADDALSRNKQLRIVRFTQFIWRKMWRNPTEEKPNQPTSIGKIYNLMR